MVGQTHHCHIDLALTAKVRPARRRRSDHRAFACGEALLGFVALVEHVQISGPRPTRHHCHMLDLEHAIERRRHDLAPSSRDRLVVPCTEVFDHDSTRLGDGVGTGMTGVGQATQRFLQLEPSPYCGRFRVDAGLTQRIAIQK